MNRKELEKKYIQIAKMLNRIPSVADCIMYGITRHMIRHHFGNISNLQKLTGLQDEKRKKEDLEKKKIYKLLGVKNNEK